jgi:hypothetical protein
VKCLNCTDCLADTCKLRLNAILSRFVKATESTHHADWSTVAFREAHPPKPPKGGTKRDHRTHLSNRDDKGLCD